MQLYRFSGRENDLGNVDAFLMQCIVLKIEIGNTWSAVTTPFPGPTIFEAYRSEIEYFNLLLTCQGVMGARMSPKGVLSYIGYIGTCGPKR